MKPLIGIQLVEVQPGQSRSGQAGSACCAVSGDRWGEAYTARKRAARVQLRNRFFVSVPTLLAWRKAALGRASRRGRSEPTESPARGTFSQGFPRNLGELLISSRNPGWVRPVGNGPGPRQLGCAACGSEASIRRRGTGCQGRPEVSGMGREQSYDPIVPRKVENRRAPETGGHGIHWREGGNKST